MKPELEILELDVHELESLLDRIQAALGEEVAKPFRVLLQSYAQLVEVLGHKEISLRRLQQLLFGAKTERTSHVLPLESPSLAADTPTASEGEVAEGDSLSSDDSTHDDAASGAEGSGLDDGSRPHRRRPGHGRNGVDAYRGCTRVAVPVGWLRAGDSCPRCSGGTVYAQTLPASLVRLVGRAPVGGTVYQLERLRCHLCGKVFTAAAPPGVGEEKYDATAISMMALLRYGQGMAWNRSANLQQALGIPLPASTQCEVLQNALDQFLPIHQHLIREAAQGDVLHNDDTGMRVLELSDDKTRAQSLRDDEPDRRGIFTSGIVSVAKGHSIALFFTGPRHAGENLKELLTRRADHLPPPIQMCDALSRNMPAELRVIVANCLSHGRRRFVDLADIFPQQVAVVLEALKQVYQADAEAKQQQLSPAERLRWHQERSGPVMDQLHRWLNQQFAEKQVEPNSSLGEAIRYLLNHWTPLTLFLRQPGAPLDNNICERALKKAILHRKNSLFYKTRRGAFMGDVYMSLIHTCFLCGADPFDYLTQLQRNHEPAAQAPEQWMPWNYRSQVAALARADPADPARDSPSVTC
jgi:flagellar biosynthesis/type III secretory pathway chaperone